MGIHRIRSRAIKLAAMALAKGGSSSEKDVAAKRLFSLCRRHQVTLEDLGEFLRPAADPFLEVSADHDDLFPPDLDPLTHCNFGKYEGKTWDEVAELDHQYLEWTYKTVDAPPEVKAAIKEALCPGHNSKASKL